MLRKTPQTSHSPHAIDPSLLFAPTFAGAGATLQAANPGDGSASDITALTPVKGSGTPTQITLGDLCVSANGVVPGTATQVLKMADCDSNDPTQLWIVLGQVSNADGNCVTLGRAAKGVDVRPLQNFLGVQITDVADNTGDAFAVLG